jgi:TonB family protein
LVGLRGSNIHQVFPAVDVPDTKAIASEISSSPDISFRDVLRFVMLPEPFCDITGTSPRFRVDPVTKRTMNRVRHIFVSAVLHVVILGAFLFVVQQGASFRDRFMKDEMVPVEIAFGLGSQWQTTPAMRVNAGQSEMDLEAQKAITQLPQLPKTLEVAAQETPPETLTIPATPTPAPTTKATPIPAPTPRATATPVAKAKQQLATVPTPSPGARALSPEELAKRLEREKRVVGSKERVGTHQKGGAGVKDVTQALPADPFAGDKTTPTSARVALGALDGSLSVSARTYQAAALNHVRRFWNLPDTFRYEPSLVAKVEVVLNLFGKILSARIVASSGDKNFDDEVLVAIDNSNPFPDFQADGLGRRTLVLSFRPREVK